MDIMANTGEIFARFFAYILFLEDGKDSGGPQRSYEQIRSDIAALLEQQKAAALRQGMPEQDYQNACFAAIAWADETLLKRPTWEHHNRWKAAPLQLEYFQTRNAGEEVFERLERLPPEQKDVREIYYLALGLGFTGRYFLGLEDELKLTQIRTEQAKHLPLLAENLTDIDKLTPQPYDVIPPDGKPIGRPATHLLAKIGILVLVVVPLLLLLAYKLWESPAPVPQLPLPAPTPLLTEADIRQAIGDQACARVDIALQGNVVTLGGRVADDAQRLGIRDAVQRLPGVGRVTETFQLLPPPFCQVLDVLEPLRQRGEAEGVTLQMALNQPGTLPVYVAGDNLIIDITTPASFDSYIYVDFYTTEGDVGHLLPNPVETRHHFTPGSTYTVGKPGDPQRLEWKIQPPFGLELVAVMASKTPLFPATRYDPERIEAYLTALRQALANQSTTAEVATTFQFITTRERR
jgi:type IV/VI secretion system ImpK/VasF family protein